jgi:hypothetical protein
MEAINVVIVSNRSKVLLETAIGSALRQDCKATVRVHVLRDDTGRESVRIKVKQTECRVTYLPPIHLKKSTSTVERVATMRNFALSQVVGRYVCFLDDDNEWEQDHLSSLLAELTTTGAVASYSWRRFVDEEGNPLVPFEHPWGQSADQRRRKYEILVKAGVYSVNDSIVRDRPSILVDGQELGEIDMGEWLFDRSRFAPHFCTQYSAAEVKSGLTEDDKLLAGILRAGLPLSATRRPTLRYRLGGYSNPRSLKP